MIGAIIALALMGVLVAIVAGRSSVRSGPRPGDRSERDQSPRWARLRDVRDLVIDEDRLADRAVLGWLEGKLLAMPPLQSVLVLAPSGMGKTARYVVPTVLRWSGAALVTSVKGDAVALTIDHRREQGPVWVFDPTGTSGIPSCRWSPLASANTYGGALRAAAWLTDSSRVEKATSNEQAMWDTLGEQLIAPLLFAARREGLGMEAVADWVLFRQEEEVAEILEQIGDRDALAHWSSIRASEGRTKASIFVTAQRILHVFAHPDVRDALHPVSGEEPFDPDALLTTGGTLYVVAPAEEQELFTPVFETLVNAVVRAAERRSAAVGGLPISPRLLLMLEEAANCAPLRRLPSIASAGRGQGIQLVSVWQDEGQIETIFPASRARTVWANHTAKITLPGVSDHRTLESMSNLVGDDSFRRTTESRGADRGQSESTSWHSERLAPPQYIRELEEGMALAVVGNRKPMRLETRAWFEDDRLRARVAPKIAASYDAAFAPAAIGGRQRRPRARR